MLLAYWGIELFFNNFPLSLQFLQRKVVVSLPPLRETRLVSNSGGVKK